MGSINNVSRKFLGGLALIIVPVTALAEAPEFDRPGFGFATSTLPVGAFAWEQGLPDLQRDQASGVHETVYTADTTLRLGVADTLEIQLAGSAWNRLDQGAMHRTGAGDTAVAVKWSPAHADSDISLAVLGMVTWDTGAAAFTNGKPVYSLGATCARDLSSGRQVALFANVDHSGGANVWTLAPGLQFALDDQVGAFVEFEHKSGAGTSVTLGGAGLAVLLHERVQLDFSVHAGSASGHAEQQAGFGISAFWK
jgi:hypothetical protein